MDPVPYTFEDVAYVTFRGERRGFMAGVVFCVILNAYYKKVKEGRLWTQSCNVPGCEH